jgi:peptide deformylase
VAPLTIRLYGDPVLRTSSRPVNGIDDDTRRLAEDMIETMKSAEGVGLAANQVGDLRRLIVIDFNPIAGEDWTEALVNPEIVSREGTMQLEEGCLSIPDVREDIERSAEIRVSYTTLDGEEKEVEADGLLSAVLQHEIDHLDGVLIVDRISPMRRALLKGVLKRITREASQGT